LQLSPPSISRGDGTAARNAKPDLIRDMPVDGAVNKEDEASVSILWVDPSKMKSPSNKL
jgi:hypothetical protein